jgi:hypothetical protein
MAIDPFTKKRILSIIDAHRSKAGVLPTLQDFNSLGVSESTIDSAVREKIIELRYVTLTSGTILKGYVSSTEK